MREALGVKRIGSFTLASMAVILTVSGAFLLGFATLSISASRSDVASETVSLGSDNATPAIHLTPAATPALGTVVIVHGFAGTKEFMRDVSYTVARAGFEVYDLDLPGHGHSLLRLDPNSLEAWFSDVVRNMVNAGRLTPGRIYLVGHSLGTLVVTKGALDNPGLGIRGVIALSPIFSDISPAQPANYLALYGESEIPGVKDTALAALQAGTGQSAPELGKVYGDFAQGTARSAGAIRGASHISIPDSREAITQAIEWLGNCAGRAGLDVPRIESEKPERVFGGIGAVLLLFGLFVLGAGNLGLLGHASRPSDADAVVREARKAAGLPEKPEAGKREPPNESVAGARKKAGAMITVTRVIPILWAFGAAITTVVLGFVGSFGFVHQAVSDYLSFYFLLLTVLTGPLIFLLGKPLQTGPLVEVKTRLPVPTAIGLGLGLSVLTVALVGGFETVAWTSLLPPASRLPQIALLAALFAPFAFFDEIIRASVHDRTGSRWAFMVTIMGKLVIAVTWYGALLLPRKPESLFVLLTPVVLILIGLDVIIGLAYKEHGSWLASALYKTLTLAWIAGTVFPLLRGTMAL